MFRWVVPAMCAVLSLLAAVPRAGAQVNAALNRPVTASGPLWPGFPASNIVDGQTTTFTHPQAATGTLGFRYDINLQTSRNLTLIRVINRDNCCPERLTNYRVSVHPDNGGAPGAAVWSAVVRANGTNSGLGGSDEVTAAAHAAGTFTGQWVRIENLSNAAYNPQLAEVQVWTDDVASPNLALNKPVTSSAATWGGLPPGNLTDGNPTTVSHPAANVQTGFFYQIDLLRVQPLDRIVVRQRGDCCPERLRNYRVSVLAESGGAPGAVAWSADVRTDLTFAEPGGADILTAAAGTGSFSGRFVRIQNLGNEAFSPQIAEVEVYRAPSPHIRFFRPDAGNITATGQPGLPAQAVLTWEVEGADSVSLNNGLGARPASGSVAVSPAAATTYTLTAVNAAGTSTASVIIAVDGVPQPLRISEFVADPGGSLRDDDDDVSDWIEIHNPNAWTVNPSGMGLSDDAALPMKWRFPAWVIPPGGRVVVFASGKDRVGTTGVVHTNFSLSRSGETLTLSAADGVVMDRVPEDWPTTPLYPPQALETGYGRNAAGAWRYFRPPSPGEANPGDGFAGVVADTRFTPRRGVYGTAQQVTIACDTPGAVIRYTTNGTAPTESTGTVYSAPITVNASTVIRAAAFAPGLAPTNVDTHSYLIPETVAAQPTMATTVTQQAVWGPQIPAALRDLPTVSLATPDPAAVNNDAEVPASIEWLDAAGGSTAAAGAGLTYFGGAFTNFAKKSFRLQFRSRYGNARFEAPLFAGADHGVPAVERFDAIELRSGSHDMRDRGFYMSNLFTDQVMLELGHVSPHGRMVHLYINGVYWGVYHLRERWNAAMMADYLGGTKEDYEAINGNYNVGGWPTPGVPYDGTGAGWEQAKLKRTDYQGIRPLVDVTNYVDYMITWMFGNSEDEYRTAGMPGPGSGFKFLMNDADGWLSVNSSNVIAAWDGNDNNTARASSLTGGVFTAGRSAGDGPGAIFAGLLLAGNADYRILLADRIEQLLGPDGALSAARNLARLDTMCQAVQRPMIPEAARWNYRLPDNWQAAWNVCRTSWVPGRTAAVRTHFRNAGLLPATTAPVFAQHGGAFAPGFALTMTGPAGATVFYTIDGRDPRQPGGAVTGTAAVYAAPVALSGNTWVKARSRTGTGEWSGLTSAFFRGESEAAVPSGAVVFSELHFNPAGDDDAEFVELMNVSTVHAVNLRGCRITGGIRHAFSPWRDVVLAPGERLVVVDSDAAHRRVHGWAAAISGVYRDQLANEGEAIVLQTENGTALASLTWSDAWSPLADGGGRSLVLVRPRMGVDLSDPANWRPSTGEAGNPGTSDDGPAFTGTADADTDGDGLSALIEYALGRSDLAREPEPALSLEPGAVVQVRCVKAAAADDAILTPEVSGDGLTWASGPAVLRPVAEEVQPGGRIRATWEVLPGASGSGNRLFVRMRARLR